jgi:putative CocE/NonD family hydrolase
LPQNFSGYIKVESNIGIPLRDRVRLSADIYKPKHDAKFPCLLVITPYNNQWDRYTSQAAVFARRGYAVVLVDSRGRHDSEGVWEPYVNEPNDGYDIQQWLGQQEWCDGGIGMFGDSYVGFTQLMPAPYRCPYVKCLVPAVNQQTNFGHLYNDGAMQLSTVFTFGLFCSSHTMQFREFMGRQGVLDNPFFNFQEIFRRLPLDTALDDIADLPHVKTWIRHPTYDDYWKSYGIKEKYGEIDVPAYFLTGWYDNLVHEAWRNFKGFREQGLSERTRKGTRILVGPWTHAIGKPESDDWAADFGPESTLDLAEVHLRWFDFWLKQVENGIDQEPPITIFVMGANRWRQENEWPLARTNWTRYYLASDGSANSLHGDGTLSLAMPAAESSHDTFIYDPDNPVPTWGGPICTHPNERGPRDRQAVQHRDDVLVYTSGLLASDVEVTGPVQLSLFATSSAVDTDFTATLSDVYADGRAVLICEGIQRASFRDSLEQPSPIEPGKTYKYTIDLWEVSNTFKAGHRIRLEISSSNFPRYARNLNTGLNYGTSAEMTIAAQTIHHDEQHLSYLLLPVIPE